MTPRLRRLVGGVLVCAATWFVTASGQEPAVQIAGHLPDELIVEFKPQSAQSRRDQVITARGARVLRRVENVHRVRVATGANLDAEMASLANDPDVLAVQPFIFAEMLVTTGKGQSSGVAIKGVDPKLVRGEAELLQARDRRLRKAFVGEVGESRAAPEGESLSEQGGAAAGISFLQGVLAVLGESLEAVEVELVGSDPEEVPGGTGEKHVARQRLAKLGDTNA